MGQSGAWLRCKGLSTPRFALRTLLKMVARWTTHYPPILPNYHKAMNTLIAPEAWVPLKLKTHAYININDDVCIHGD
jgi:hypothetical protein